MVATDGPWPISTIRDLNCTWIIACEKFELRIQIMTGSKMEPGYLYRLDVGILRALDCPITTDYRSIDTKGPAQ